MRKPIALLLAFVFLAVAVFSFYLFFFSRNANPLSRVHHWFILLGYDPSRTPLTASDVRGYEMAILDADSHPDLKLFGSKTILIGYVSVGEAEVYRDYWARIKDRPWVLEENKNWGGNYFVDVRDPQWRAILLDEVIPQLVSKGFDGIFLDTLDTAEYLESLSPDQFSGSKRAMSELVRDIHQRYPKLFLISNNGFAILPEIEPYLSGLLSESLLSMPDFKAGGYAAVPAEERADKIKRLREAAAKKNLPVFIVDYAAKSDTGGRLKIQKELKALGFRPYLAEKNLSEMN